MKVSKITKSLLASGVVGAAGLAVTASTNSAQAADITKASTGTEFADGASWVGGVVPGDGDVAVFDSNAGPSGSLNWDDPDTGSPPLGGIRILDPNFDIDINLTDVVDIAEGISSNPVVFVDMSSATRDLTWSTDESDGQSTRIRGGSGFGSIQWNIASGQTFTLGTGVSIINYSGSRTIEVAGGGAYLVNGVIGDTGDGVRLGMTVTNGTVGGTGTIAPDNAGDNQIGAVNVSANGRIAPGAGGIGALTIDSVQSDAPSILAMASGSSLGFELGAAGSFATPGNSDQLVLANSAADDVEFNDNVIDFLGTGEEGLYRLLDGLESADEGADTWSGLTLSGREITSGLSVSNLSSGLSGTLYLGDGADFGDAGDIYLQVAPVPEPGSLSLLGLGGLAVMGRRRRRRKA